MLPLAAGGADDALLSRDGGLSDAALLASLTGDGVRRGVGRRFCLMSPDFGLGVGCQGGEGGDRFSPRLRLAPFLFLLRFGHSRHSSLFKQREDPLLRL